MLSTAGNPAPLAAARRPGRDLDTEAGDFHEPGTKGVYHHGFARELLVAMLREAGFVEPNVTTACEVSKNDRRYSIFLAAATRPR